MAKFKLRDGLAIGIPAAGLAVSTANFVTNKEKRKENKIYQEKNLKVLGDLTKSLNTVNTTMNNLPKDREVVRIIEKPVYQKRRGLLEGLFQKNNSYTGDLAWKGAVLGAAGGAGLSSFLPTKVGGTFDKIIVGEGKKKKVHPMFISDPNYKHPKFKKKYNKLEESGFRQLLITLGGSAVGATLGALAGAVMDISNAVSRKSSVNNRLMKDVLENLKRAGFKERTDYTRDPKIANLLKTKVSLVISKSGDSLRLLINTINDPKLKKISSTILKNLPTMSSVTERANDRFNELSVTTMTTNNGDAAWVESIAERFIKAGYPVYLVEVG